MVAGKYKILLCQSGIERSSRIKSLGLSDAAGEELHLSKVGDCKRVFSVPHTINLLLEVLLYLWVLSNAVKCEQKSVGRLFGVRE